MNTQEVILILLDEGFEFNEEKKIFHISLNDSQDNFIASILDNSKEVILGAKCTKGKDIMFLSYNTTREQFMSSFRNFMYRSL
ncbi:MAG: hypothetical protein R3321_00655 [Nitrososphaeraceae archaeon]|nr:hypothetical protein [Nitrososphaeraceae archaeon]